MIIFEFGKPLQINPFTFTGVVGDKPFYRWGWLYFAVSYTSLSQKQYFYAIKQGNVIWQE